MRELSLHILDLAQNSLTAGASRLDIIVEIDHKKDLVAITLSDDGKGMAPDFLKTVTSPFTTTRTTRKVGLGIPMFKENAELTGGTFSNPLWAPARRCGPVLCCPPLTVHRWVIWPRR